MLHLNEKNFFYYRFDLTKKTPAPTKILWVQTVMLHLNENFFLLQIWLDQKDPGPHQNFMGANCNVTPQWKFFFITDLTWPKRPRPPPKFYGCKL